MSAKLTVAPGQCWFGGKVFEHPEDVVTSTASVVVMGVVDRVVEDVEDVVC